MNHADVLRLRFDLDVEVEAQLVSVDDWPGLAADVASGANVNRHCLREVREEIGGGESHGRQASAAGHGGGRLVGSRQKIAAHELAVIPDFEGLATGIARLVHRNDRL